MLPALNSSVSRAVLKKSGRELLTGLAMFAHLFDVKVFLSGK